MLKKIVLLFCIIITNNYAMNRVTSLVPIAVALQLPATKLLGLCAWNAVNKQQKKLIKQQLPNYSDEILKKCGVKMYQSPKGLISDNLNKYGFNIKLSKELPWHTKSSVAIVSKKYQWKSSVSTTQIVHENVSYPAIYTTASDKDKYHNELEATIDGIRRFDQNATVEISLPTVQGDTIVLHIASTMRKKYNLIKQQVVDRYPACHQIYIPKIDLDYCPDVSWLRGMHRINPDTANQTEYIHEIQQQIQLQLDQEGIRFASAVAIAQSPEKCEPTIKAEKKPQHKEFGLIIKQSESSEPLVSAYIEVDDWKQPKKLRSLYPFSNPAILDHIKGLQYMFDKNRWYDYKSVINRLEELFYLLEKNPKMAIQSTQLDQDIMHRIELIKKQFNDLDSEEWSRLFHNHSELYKLLDIFAAYKEEFHPEIIEKLLE